ncbi:MAG: PhnB protein [Mucilaginibacter sp.]|nr:PhnB protein [Mucilaginibacter sp.]
MENQVNGTFQTAIIPTLSVINGAAAIAFYKKAFGAIELMCITAPDGAVVAELSIDGARFFLADESPEQGNLSPEKLGGISVRMGLFVADPDAVTAVAVAAGATEIYPVADQDYGYRLGHIKDPFGHHWEICRPL